MSAKISKEDLKKYLKDVSNDMITIVNLKTYRIITQEKVSIIKEAAFLQYAYKWGKKNEVGNERIKNAGRNIYEYIHRGEKLNEGDFNRIEADFDFKKVCDKISTTHDRLKTENGTSNDPTVEDLIDGNQRSYAALIDMSVWPMESAMALFWLTYECRKVFHYSRAIGLAMQRYRGRNESYWNDEIHS